jgi:hypothetical protein
VAGLPRVAFAVAVPGTAVATIQCRINGAAEPHYGTQWIPND